MSEKGISQGGFLLTGGSGMVGRALQQQLQRLGSRTVLAVRSDSAPAAGAANSSMTRVPWQPGAARPFADPSLLEGLEVAVHLSGANLAARRWTAAYKQEIVSSRTVTTLALARTLALLQQPPRLLIAASATGIYGDRGDEALTEASTVGDDFLSRTCEAWEQATAPAEAAGIRVVHLRLGVVLDPRGGALAKVLPLFRAGLGGRLGNGRQWMSWIAIGDLVRAVLHLASTEATPLAGPVNCVSPEPVTNASYTRALGRVLNRPAFATAPAFALRLALGEMADAALLASCRAMPQKLLAAGFQFQTGEISMALEALLKR